MNRFTSVTLVGLVVGGTALAAGPAQAATGVVTAATAITAPTVTATAAVTSVKLTWTSAGTGTSYYRVFKSTTSTVSTSGTPLKDKISASTRTYTATGLTAGHTYYFKVSAVSGSTTKISAAVHATAKYPAPTAPTALKTTANTATAVTIAWTAGSNTTGYKVYRGTTSTVSTTGTPLSGTTALASTVKTYKDSTVAAAKTYYYVVVASGLGGTATSASLKVTTPAATTPAPGAPGSVKAVNSSGSVVVTWTAGSSTTGFKVYRSTTSTVSTTGTPVSGTTALSASTLSFTDTTVAASTQYWYVVVASNAGTSTTTSATATVTTPTPATPAPGAPTSVTATNSSGSVVVGWVAGSSTTGFKVYRSSTSTVDTTGTPVSGTTALSASTTSYTDTTVAASSTYYYVVVASNSGTATTTSASAMVTTPAAATPAPGTPTLTATPASGAIGLSWTAASNATGYSLYRSTSSTVDTTGTPIATTTTALTYNDTAVTAGSTYYYVVVANGDGGSTASTVKSAVVPPATSGGGTVSLTVPGTITTLAGASGTGTITVKNTGAGTLTVSSVVLSGTSSSLKLYSLDSSAAAGFVLASGASQDVTVTYTAGNLGTTSVTVTVNSDDSKTPAKTGTVKGTSTDGNFGSLVPTNGEWAATVGLTMAPLLGQQLTGLRMAFNRIGYDGEDKTDTLHTQPYATETFTNSGSSTVTVTDIETNGSYNGYANWSILSAPTLPATVAPGASISVQVQFDYCRLSCTATTHPANGVVYGTLQLTTDDPGHETASVLLAGGWQADEGGGNELSLTQWVNGVLGITTVLSTSAEPINEGNGEVVAVGDEVLSTSFQALDTTQPVSVRQILATHGVGGHEPFYWYTNHDKTTSVSVFQQAATDYQTVLPGGSNGPVAGGTFNPGSAVFELQVNNNDYSDDSLNSTTNDVRHGCTGTCGHHVRFYPVKNASGTVVTGLWLMAVDTTGVNLDYNDEVYLISNITPAS